MVEIRGNHGPLVPDTLLGVNLELGAIVSEALLSDRLTNSKFCGPADEMTGLAPGWRPVGLNMGDVHNALVQGMFLSGNSSQLVHAYAHECSAGLLQTGRYIDAEEELEVEIWAKTRHHPVALQVALRPESSRAPSYCEGEVVIDAAYWKSYKLRLKSSVRDLNAVFFVILKTRGVVYFDQIHLRPVGQPLLSSEMQERIQELSPSTLRFPGGCMSTNYHWRLGIGQPHVRPSLPDPVFKKRTDYDFGTSEYLAICHEYGIRPFITVNIGSGVPADAGAWAKYCADWFEERGLELPEIYFQAGNEQYGSWESSHMNARMYLEALKEFVPEIRKNYPKATILGLGEPLCSGVAGQPDTNLRELLLTEGHGLMDVITINRYKGQWYDDAEEQMLNVPDSVEKIRCDLVQLIQECRKAKFSAKVGLTEWGYWLHASHWDEKDFFEPDDALHGLFVSGVLHMLARLAPDVEVGAYYHLVNGMGIIRNDGGRVSVTSISEVFQLYRPAFPGEILDLEVVAPELKAGVSQVDIVAMRQQNTLWLFASNRSLTESTTLSVKNLDPSTCKTNLLTAENSVSPLRERRPVESGKSWNLPPLSLVRIWCGDYFESLKA